MKAGKNRQKAAKPKQPGQIAQKNAVTSSGPPHVQPKLLRRWPQLALAAALIGVTAAYFFTPKQTPNAKPAGQAFTVTSARNGCKAPPAFMRTLGFGARASLSTSERDVLGLAAVDFDSSGKRIDMWQHPSWRSAGNLAAFALDQRGDVYVLPAPRVNLLDNPPAQQNRLYRIDGQTGALTLVLEFPVAAAVDQRNPYAGLGLGYDCDLDSLFLSSVAGSNYTTQKGKVFRVALMPTPHIAATLSDIDAFAVTSVNSTDGPALLLGSARSSEVAYIALDASGDFPAGVRPSALLSLADVGPEGNDRARKIEIAADASVIIRGTRFAYNLAQPPAQDAATVYHFGFDQTQQRYSLQRWTK
jgi:hypothetical protein